MAAISITAANVAKGSNAVTRNVHYGGTVTAGMAVYEDTSDSNDAKAADYQTSAATAAAAGVALNGGADGQPGQIQTDGDITIGGTVTVGEIYVVGGSGEIIPESDLVGDDYVTILGVGISATQIRLGITASGVQVPT